MSRIERLQGFRDLDNLPAGTNERDIVERCLEVISEASRRLPEALKAQNPQINWRRLADLGNVLRHGYQHVSDVVLLEVLRNHLDPLATVVASFLADLPPDE